MSDRFDELLAKSQKLTTFLGVGSDTNLPNLRRGINELDTAKSFGVESKKHLAEQEKLNAVRILAQKNFDAVKLSSDISDIAIESQYSSIKSLDSIDLDGYLQHHHDMLILNVIRDTNRVTEEYVRASQRRLLANEWSQSRKKFIESLGHVTQHWNKKQVSSMSSTSTTAMVPYSIDTNTNTFPPSKLPILSSLSTPFKSGTSLEGGGGSVQQSTGMTSLMKSHYMILKALINPTIKTSSITPCMDLSNTVSLSSEMISSSTSTASLMTVQVDDNGLTATDLLGYKSLLEMMSYMVGEQVSSRTKVEPGLYASITFTPENMETDSASYTSATPIITTTIGSSQGRTIPSSKNITLLTSILNKKQVLSLGTKQYLEHQQLQALTVDIDECIRKGYLEYLALNNDGTSRINHIKSYIYYLWKLGNLYTSEIDLKYISLIPITNLTSPSNTLSPSSTSGMVPLWAVVYTCLITGDIKNAIQVLQYAYDSNVRYIYKEMIVVLEYFQLFTSQTTKKLSKYDTLTSSHMIDIIDMELTSSQQKECLDAIHKCHELYQQEIHESHTRALDPYKVLILNLFSLTDMSTLSDPGLPSAIYTLQNYIWCNICFIMYERYINILKYGKSQVLSTLKFMDQGENGFYTMILDYGGDTHFDPYHNNPLKYASLLCTCHRYGDAIYYLWNQTKTFIAIHMTLLCLYYGLILPHTPLLSNPVFYHSSIVQKNSSLDIDLTPSTMLQYYLNTNIQRAFPELSLDYFMYLKSSWVSVVQNELFSDQMQSHKISSNNLISNVLEKFLTLLPKEALTYIVGTPETGNKLSHGYLHDYLTRDEVNGLLYRIANNLIQIKHEYEAGIYMYQLSGHYVEAMIELTSQLAQCVTQKDSRERTYWIDLATHFYETYIHNGSGPLMDTLIQLDGSSTISTMHGRQDLLEQFLKVLNISLYVTHIHKQEWIEALQVLDEINILPRQEQEISTYIQSFQVYTSNSALVRIIDDILLFAMELYLQLIAIYFKESQSSINTSTQQANYRHEMEYIRYRCNCMITFTTHIASRLMKNDTLKTLHMMYSRLN